MSQIKIMVITPNGIKEYREFETQQTKNIQKIKEEESLLNVKSSNKMLFTFSEIQEIFDCSRPTIYNWIKNKILPYVKIGGRTYFRKDDIITLINKQRIN